MRKNPTARWPTIWHRICCSLPLAVVVRVAFSAAAAVCSAPSLVFPADGGGRGEVAEDDEAGDVSGGGGCGREDEAEGEGAGSRPDLRTATARATSLSSSGERYHKEKMLRQTAAVTAPTASVATSLATTPTAARQPAGRTSPSTTTRPRRAAGAGAALSSTPLAPSLLASLNSTTGRRARSRTTARPALSSSSTALPASVAPCMKPVRCRRATISRTRTQIPFRASFSSLSPSPLPLPPLPPSAPTTT